jgi:hypothetical protein
MFRRSLIAAILSLAGMPAFAQTPITNFAEVAGKWSGISSRGTQTDVVIGADGSFGIETKAGKDSGKARLADGGLIFSFTDNQGQYKFLRKGDRLEGVVHWRGVEATVIMARVSGN